MAETVPSIEMVGNAPTEKLYLANGEYLPWGAVIPGTGGTRVGDEIVNATGDRWNWEIDDWDYANVGRDQSIPVSTLPVDLSQPFTPAMREPMAAPTGVRFNLQPEFGPVTPSGYAQSPVDPLSYYQSPTTMGGGGFDNLGGGFKGTTTPSVGITPSTTPSGGGATTTPGFTYKEGEYDPATGIGVVYFPGPDEQVTSQQQPKQTTPPWSSVAVPGGGGGAGVGGGGSSQVGGGGGGYGFISNIGTPLDPYTEQRYNIIGSGPRADIITTPLVGPRFETEPVTVTIPVEQKQPTTTPTTKTETTTTAPAETKPTTTISPIRQTKIEVPQRPTVQIPQPTITPDTTSKYAPFDFNKLIGQGTIKPNLIDLAPVTNRNYGAKKPMSWGDLVNYDPEEILAAAMRSMSNSRLRTSLDSDLQLNRLFSRMSGRG
jgi:hypothetical protein